MKVKHPSFFFFFFKLFFDNLIFKGRLSADTFCFLAQKGNTRIAIHFPARRVEEYLLLKGQSYFLC